MRRVTVPRYPYSTSLLTAVLLLSLPAPGEATTLRALDARDLVVESSLIVQAKCVELESYRDQRGLIVTRYTFDVTDTLKGEHSARLRFVQPGGEFRGVATIIPGLSPHRIGDEVVLFMPPPEGVDEETRIPVGLDQGVYRITTREDENGATSIVTRMLAQVRLVPGKKSSLRVAQFPENVDLETFKKAVRAKVAEYKQ